MWGFSPLLAAVLVPWGLVPAARVTPGVVAQACDSNAAIQVGGVATASSRGLLQLDVEGAPVMGHPFALRVRNAPQIASGWLRVEPSTPVPQQPTWARLDLRFTTDSQGSSALLLSTPVSLALCR